MKTVVLECDAYGDGRHRFHSQLLQLSKDSGFSIRLCRLYGAKTKGKVERFNRHLRNSFWVPLKTRFAASGLTVDVHSTNEAVTRWLAAVANVRSRGELHERPVDRWQAERAYLLPYRAVVKLAPRQSRSVPIPVESLQHPLSTYYALVSER